MYVIIFHLFFEEPKLTFFAVFPVGRNRAFNQLNRKPPPSSLIGLTPLSSIVLQIALVLIMQLLAIVIVKMQPWYKEHTGGNPDDLASHDNYAIFASSVFQYITLAVVFSKGKPYREPLYANSEFQSIYR